MTKSSTRRKAKTPPVAPSADLLEQARSLLYMGVNSLEAHANEGSGRPAPDTIRALVQAACRNVEQRISERGNNVPTELYQALSVLMLMDAALTTRGVLDSVHCDPILNGLTIAEELILEGLNESAQGGRMSATIDDTPSRTVRLPRFDDIEVSATEDDGEIRVVYHGSPEDLIAAGIVTPQMLAMGHRGDRSRRFDGDGHRWNITAWWVGMNCGQPRRRFRVAVRKPVAAGRRLPGVPQALVAYTACEAHYEGRREEHKSEMRRDAERPRRTALRLVVDNTRPEVRS